MCSILIYIQSQSQHTDTQKVVIVSEGERIMHTRGRTHGDRTHGAYRYIAFGLFIYCIISESFSQNSIAPYTLRL